MRLGRIQLSLLQIAARHYEEGKGVRFCMMGAAAKNAAERLISRGLIRWMRAPHRDSPNLVDSDRHRRDSDLWFMPTPAGLKAALRLDLERLERQPIDADSGTVYRMKRTDR